MLSWLQFIIGQISSLGLISEFKRDELEW